jgi:hypothetical protein
MKIDYVNEEYTKLNNKWKLINSMCDVEDVEDYITPLNPQDLTAANVTRNQTYRDRAVFYELASFTRSGLLGMLFRKWPKFSAPAQLEYLAKNADGEGNSIYQQSQQVAKSVIGKGKAGLLVDFPQVDGDISVEDMNSMRYVSTIKKFEPEQILLPIDTITIGAETKVSRIRLKTSVYEDGIDIPVIRVLELLDNIYWSSEYRDTKEGWVLVKEAPVKGGDGNYLDEIPFIFIGSETNTKQTNKPPMYGICKINVGHYNNSASYEDSVHFVGQVQPVASGMPVSEIKEMEKEGMYWGSGRLIGMSDPSGKFVLLQGEPNMIAREAMDAKVKDAVGLGAMFVMPGSAVKTATQSEGEQIVQHSILSLIASNLTDGYTLALQWACVFMNVNPPADMVFQVYQDFVAKNAEPQLLQQLLAGLMSGNITQGAYISYLQKMEIEDPEKTVEEIKEELQSEGAAAGELNLNQGV